MRRLSVRDMQRHTTLKSASDIHVYDVTPSTMQSTVVFLKYKTEFRYQIFHFKANLVMVDG